MKSRKNKYLSGTPIATSYRCGVPVYTSSPKNFMLQTEPQIQEVLKIRQKGDDFFLQITDARLDTGGLSGATPSEAVSWGKVDPEGLPDTVVAYLDSTIAMPVMVSYALSKRRPRKLRRLYDRRVELVESLRREYEGALKKEHSHHKPKEGHR